MKNYVIWPFIYINIHTYIYIHIYVCIYVYICIYIICVFMSVCAIEKICICMRARHRGLCVRAREPNTHFNQTHMCIWGYLLEI